MVAAGRNYDLCYPRKMEETCSKDQNMDKAVRLHPWMPGLFEGQKD